MALPAWGGFPVFRVLEVVDQNLAESAPFSPLWRGQGRSGVVPEGRTGSIPSDLDLIFAEGGTCKDEVKLLHRGCPQIYQYPSFSLENPPCSQAPRGWFGLEWVWAVE